MIDTHIHIGQFNDLYTFPKELLRFLDLVGVDIFAVSSTTTCERDYDKVLLEMQNLVKIAGSRVLPVLWVVPEMIEGNIISRFLESGVKWRMLKIHPQLSPVGSWTEESPYSKELLSMARGLRVPVLIHTGEIDGCYPSQFKEMISGNPDIKFILAHGRPISQTVEIMQINANVWCDTAFMPTENIAHLCNAGLVDGVLWGTDYPIPKYFYPNRDMEEYYRSILSDLKSSVSEEDFTKITGLNAQRLFYV